MTALSLLRHAPVAAGDTVVVAAAAGGAGSLLVQLATSAGARVVAAARGERKLALARDLGADLTVDYGEDGWQHRLRAATGGDGVDVAFDGAGGPLGPEVFDAVVRGGRFVTYGTAGGGFTAIDPELAAQRRVDVTNALATRLEPAVTRELLAEELAHAAASGCCSHDHQPSASS